VIVPEDYYRVLKEKKEVEEGTHPKQKFDQFKSHLSSKLQHSKLSPDKKGSTDLLEGDDDLDEIVLPPETLYLIDKVVRQKAREGPIGQDNSELINLENEEEYKEKNQHLLALAGQQQEHMDSENKENVNERLLHRLT